MSSSDPVGRRGFLARIGLLGAAVSAGALLPGSALATPTAAAATLGNPLDGAVTVLRPILDALALDTMKGLAVFACPGPDPYSWAQGTPRREPGAIEAKAPQFLVEALDGLLPLPDDVLRPVIAALATGLADSGITLPGPIALPGLGTLDKALTWILRNDSTVPLAVVAASLLNLVATSVNPWSVVGVLGSPFSRLSYAQKAQVFARLEAPLPALVATLDVNLPQPLKESVSGLLKYLGGSLLEVAALGSYSEHAVFNPKTKQLTGRPVGWQLSRYQPNGPVEGWDEFLGYYQNRMEVRD